MNRRQTRTNNLQDILAEISIRHTHNAPHRQPNSVSWLVDWLPLKWMLLNAPTRNELGLKCFSHYTAKTKPFNLLQHALWNISMPPRLPLPVSLSSPCAYLRSPFSFFFLVFFVCRFVDLFCAILPSLICQIKCFSLIALVLQYTFIARRSTLTAPPVRRCCFWRCRHKLLYAAISHARIQNQIYYTLALSVRAPVRIHFVFSFLQFSLFFSFYFSVRIHSRFFVSYYTPYVHSTHTHTHTLHSLWIYSFVLSNKRSHL